MMFFRLAFYVLFSSLHKCGLFCFDVCCVRVLCSLRNRVFVVLFAWFVCLFALCCQKLFFAVVF